MPPKEKKITPTHANGKEKEDYSLKETSPNIIGAGKAIGKDKLTLVEQREFLYVRIVKANNLPVNIQTGSCDPFVEVKIGNYIGTTRHMEQTSCPEWNQVFAFTKDRLQGGVVEILVRNKEFVGDEIIGCVSFVLADVPIRFPPDSTLAPQWYRLEDRNKQKVVGELMLAVWIGNQMDDAFSVAWHSDAATVSGESVANTRPKVYHSPRLWYLRILVIEALELVPSDKNRRLEVYVKAALENMVLRTRNALEKNQNPSWNEELMLVAAEPFDEPLVLSVHDKVNGNREECLGRCVIPLQTLERRLLPVSVGSKWINLEKHVMDGKDSKEVKFSGRLHLTLFLDGVYHVFDETTYYSSDLRATSPMLWPDRIGVLELGIIKAEGLLPMKSKDGRGTTDAYCVAKYGNKWVKTSTIVDSFTPNWNEQYYWDVYDPYTVVTIGVFDNCHLQGGGGSGGASKNPRLGKVRIRLSTLETDRIYTHSYPLIVLQPTGLKKMGELHLAVKFSCTCFANLFQSYTQPLLPNMHYINPLGIYQLDSLRHQATYILCSRLGRADPPLRKEIIEYMLDTGANMWSLRRGKANCERLLTCLSSVAALWQWFDEIRQWKNPATIILIHLMFIGIVMLPRFIMPILFYSLFIVGVFQYPKRPRHPPHMDTKLSHAETAHPDELDEEFDTFPTSKQGEVLKTRYDRLRGIAGRLMIMMGDLATQLERVQALISWRDPRATLMFIVFCLIAATVTCFVRFQYLLIIVGTYIMRPPRMRVSLPSIPQNFLRRLPSKTDSML